MDIRIQILPGFEAKARLVVKMVLFRVAGGKVGRILSLGLLLLLTARISLISGQQGTRLCSV
jgi:hypothetical protein